MTSIEANTHAFVVRVWREEGRGGMTWRGHITHVLSGQQSSFNNLDGILPFIASFLDDSDGGKQVLTETL